MESNTEKRENQASKYMQMEKFFTKIIKNPSLMMLWGDIGTGKTTFALQFSQFMLKKNKKVFYLLTKRSSHSHLINRILGSNWNGIHSNFVLWRKNTLYTQAKVIFTWALQIKKLKKFFKEDKVGLLIVDEITNSYILEMGSKKVNDKLNRQFLTIMATLANFVREYKIPVLLLNTFTMKNKNSNASENISDEFIKKPIFKEKGTKNKEKGNGTNEYDEENENDEEDENDEDGGNIKDTEKDELGDEFSEKKEKLTAVPHGGDLVGFWTEFEVKVQRGPHPSVMVFKVSKNKLDYSIPKKWNWSLDSKGF